MISATTAISGMRIGPRITWNVRPCSAWIFRSSIAAQIHIAGKTSINKSRQFVTSMRTPSKSMAKAPIKKPSGAR